MRIQRLAVGKMPMSGKANELYDYEEISAESIVKMVKEVINY